VKIKRFVRQSLFLMMILAPVTQLHSEPLSTIEAHEFASTPLQKSKSGRVYLFRTEEHDLPKTGNLVLIQDNNKPAMAFRVLRTDPVNHEYIATRVRRYDQTGELKINQNYNTVEKVADLLAPPPQAQKVYDANAKPEMGTKWTPEKTADATVPDANAAPTPAPVPLMGTDGVGAPEVMADNNTPPSADNTAAPGAPAAAATTATPQKHLDVDGYDDELDSTTSPRDLKKENMDGDDEEETDSTGLPKTQYEVDEKQRLEKYKHMLSLGVGYFKNMSNFSLGGLSYGGLNVDYSWIIDHDIYVHARSLQDDLRMTFGFEYYTSVNPSGNNDSYSLFPLYADLVYNLHISDSMTFDGYFGLQYNWVQSAQNSNTPTYNTLAGIQGNIGVGLLYNLGPQWYLRADFGLDRVGVGLSIKW
jgi:hypothetical protein